MALGVAFTRITSIYPNGNFLQWDLKDATESGAYTFDVLRSGGPEGPWDTLATGLVNTNNYLDKLSLLPVDGEQVLNQLSLQRGIYYKVVVTPPSGVANQASAVEFPEPHLTGRMKLLKRKLLRDEALALRKVNGLPVALVQKMTWGPRCPRCYDKYNKESVRGNCTNCLGTTYTPGYFNPIITYARRGNLPIQTQMTPQGTTEIANAQVTMLNVPHLEIDDILVFLEDNRRFIVKQLMPSEVKAVRVYQRLVVSELARNSIEYRIRVDPTNTPQLF